MTTPWWNCLTVIYDGTLAAKEDAGGLKSLKDKERFQAIFQKQYI
jgi:hypothetical protein